MNTLLKGAVPVVESYPSVSPCRPSAGPFASQIDTAEAWARFQPHVVSWLEEGSGAEVDLVTAHALRLFHHQLMESVPAYGELLEICSSRPVSRENPWLWYPLQEGEWARVGLLTVTADHPLPLHDHPGSSGLLLVLSGEVRVRQFDIAGVVWQRSRVGLQHRSDCSLAKYEISAFRAYCGNIHGIEALSERAILLDLLLHPCHDAMRSWYFPRLDMGPSISPIIADRVPCRNLHGPAS